MSGHACPCTAACFVRKFYISCSAAESVSNQRLARDELVTAHTLYRRAINHAQIEHARCTLDSGTQKRAAKVRNHPSHPTSRGKIFVVLSRGCQLGIELTVL